MNRLHSYIEENLMNKKWLAMWKGPYDGSTCHTVDILVEVLIVFNYGTQFLCPDTFVMKELAWSHEIRKDFCGLDDMTVCGPTYPTFQVGGNKLDFWLCC